MALTRWQASIVDMFTEIGRLEYLVKMRVNSQSPAGMDEQKFVILNHLSRMMGQGDTRTALLWSLDGAGAADGDLDELIERGCIVLIDDRLHLSPHGIATYEGAVTAMSPEFEQLFPDLTAETIEDVMTKLREIRRTLDNLPDL